MSEEVHSSTGAKDMENLLELDELHFFNESHQLALDAVFRPRADFIFSTTAFNKMEMGGSTRNSVLLDKKEEYQQPPPTTSILGRLTVPPRLLRSFPFGIRNGNVPDVRFNKRFL